MNIFDIINGVAFDKHATLLDAAEHDKDYQPFLVNRWLSMLDASAACIVNDTLNRFGSALSPKDQYKFLLHVLPAYRKQRIQYIKKLKPPVDLVTQSA